MAFDPSVISSIPDLAGNPVAAQEKAVTMKDMMDRQQLNSLALSQAKEEDTDNRKVKEILKSSDYSTPEGLAKTAEKVNKVSPRASRELLKEGQAYQSGQYSNQVQQLELMQQRQDLIVRGIDPIVSQARQMKNQGASDLEVRAYISQQMPQALQQLRGMKLDDGKPALPDDVLKMVTSVPHDLATLEKWEGMSKAGQNAIKQRLEQFKAEVQGKKEEETERHNQTTERETARRDDIAQQRADTADKKAQGTAFTPEEGDLMAALAERSVSLPTGLRTRDQMKATFSSLISRHPDKTPDQIADDIKSGKLKLAAETKGAQTAGTQIGKVALAANELDTFGDQTLSASNAIPRGKFVPWNKLKQMGAKQISDKSLLRFKAKMQALENAYNQLAGRSGTDVEKRAHIHELFNTSNDPGAVETLVQALKEEAVGAREAADRTIAETSGSSIPGAAPPGSAPTGAATSRATPPSAAAGAAAPARPNDPLKPGSKYQHPSGATIEIIK